MNRAEQAARSILSKWNDDPDHYFILDRTAEDWWAPSNPWTLRVGADTIEWIALHDVGEFLVAESHAPVGRTLTVLSRARRIPQQTALAVPEGRADAAAPEPTPLFVPCDRPAPSCPKCYGTGWFPRALTDEELRRAVLDGAMSTSDAMALARWSEARERA